MRLRVHLFATFREIVGSAEIPWTAREGATLASLVDEILATYPRLAGHRGSMLLAVNESFATPDAILHDGDEVALLPPVSGGVR